MDRLIAWYRVGSSVGAVASLVVANLIPLLGVLFLGWSVWAILIIYWLENGVVGLFNVLKMGRAAGPETPGSVRFTFNGRPVAGAGRAALIPFFIVHYGMFWLVHGIFVLTLPLFSAVGPDVAPPVGAGLDLVSIVIVLIGLAISHGVSYRLNFIGRGEYLRVSPAQQAFAPYGRLVILHVTIIFGGMAIAFTGAPAAAIVVLVLLKTAMDLAFHLSEHRAVGAGSGAGPGATPERPPGTVQT